MIINGKYIEIKTSAHRIALPTKLWKIDYKHGISNSIIVEAETEDEAKRIGLAESRKTSGFINGLSVWPENFVVKSAVCIKDFAAEAPAQT